LKAKAQSLEADARIRYAEQFDELEQKVEATKNKLKELGEANEDNWEQFKDGVENSWGALRSAVREAIAKFKN
jgi:predicted phage gp36 major capsid-like protein